MTTRFVAHGQVSERLTVVRHGSATSRIKLPSNPTGWVTVLKNVDESVQDNFTLFNDAELSFVCPSSERHAFRGCVFFTTTNAADYRFGVDASSTPTLWRCAFHMIPNGATSFSSIEVETTDGNSNANTTGTGTDGVLWFDGIIQNDTSEDITVSYQWAQAAVDATTTTTLAGSYIEHRLVN